MVHQIKGNDSVANYSKVVYHNAPSPTLISTIVKSGTSMALRLSSHHYISIST